MQKLTIDNPELTTQCCTADKKQSVSTYSWPNTSKVDSPIRPATDSEAAGVVEEHLRLHTELVDRELGELARDTFCAPKVLQPEDGLDDVGYGVLEEQVVAGDRVR